MTAAEERAAHVGLVPLNLSLRGLDEELFQRGRDATERAALGGIRTRHGYELVDFILQEDGLKSL